MPDTEIFHASSVALGDRAALVTGASGSGKSSLALHLMALGATLISDDRTIATRSAEGHIVLAAPEPIRGLIEARGVGLLRAETTQNALLAVVIDLDAKETDRLPIHRSTEILGVPIPLLRNAGSLHFAHAILQYLKAGRKD